MEYNGQGLFKQATDAPTAAPTTSPATTAAPTTMAAKQSKPLWTYFYKFFAVAMVVLTGVVISKPLLFFRLLVNEHYQVVAIGMLLALVIMAVVHLFSYGPTIYSVLVALLIAYLWKTYAKLNAIGEQALSNLISIPNTP
jgi:hypothetical protein